MDKAAAQAEALRLWHALPARERQTHHQATAFAAVIAPQLAFETLGVHDKIVEGWLVRDLLRTEEAVRVLDEKAARHDRDRKVRALVEGH